MVLFEAFSRIYVERLYSMVCPVARSVYLTMLAVVVPVTFRSNASAPAIGAVDIFKSGDVGLFTYCVTASLGLLDVPLVNDDVVEDGPL